MCSPSAKPLALATDQLPVAMAFAPAAATALALPASQTLNSTNGLPGTCSARNSLALRSWPVIFSSCRTVMQPPLIFPQLPRLFGDQLGHLLREEQIRAFHSAHATRAGKCTVEPLSPLYPEERILQPPNHSRPPSPLPQSFANGNQRIRSHRDRVLIHLRLLQRRLHQWSEVSFNGFICKALRIRVC